jgi:hypothetical protein
MEHFESVCVQSRKIFLATEKEKSWALLGACWAIWLTLWIYLFIYLTFLGGHKWKRNSIAEERVLWKKFIVPHHSWHGLSTPSKEFGYLIWATTTTTQWTWSDQNFVCIKWWTSKFSSGFWPNGIFYAHGQAMGITSKRLVRTNLRDFIGRN